MCGPGRLTLFDFPPGCVYQNQYSMGANRNAISRASCKSYSKHGRHSGQTETGWHMLTDEAKRRAWKFHIARELGWPEPPPFYTSYNPISWMAAGLHPEKALVRYAVGKHISSGWSVDTKKKYKEAMDLGAGGHWSPNDDGYWWAVEDAQGTAAWGAREQFLSQMMETGGPASWEETCNWPGTPYKTGHTRPGHNKMHHPLARVKGETWWGHTNNIENTSFWGTKKR